MAGFKVQRLDTSTWPAFAALVERNNGVWGGCWCMSFHPEGVGKGRAPGQNRADKQARVERGEAHAALVFDGEICVGWCQFGSPAELPRIKARRAYEAEPTPRADWRITCLFVDKTQRRRGVAAAALAGALGEIARLGGGTVESFPEDTEGRSVSASFLHNGNLAMFEQAGFTRQRRLGKDRWLATAVVKP
ncbi:MAG TPA: hypothetical protein VGV07_21495 [Devosia sp.]|jgi:GNAT superfamily N-acetyltransferase|uniref:hypothetical protein n=1 Tax=Devosia sp. TaxID=1871048 RepID=UPI002DDD5028|nr:hypothetical protein [Devosia sp.]HEV2517841.1 hypothetical protein [Devosia sp.]